MNFRRTHEEIAADLRRLQEHNGVDLDRGSLLREISAYQEELRAQNQTLRVAHAALEERCDRLAELYDLAPNAYITLDPNGIILQCNLTAEALFSRPRTALEGVPLLGFVAPAARSMYLDFLHRCKGATQERVECDIALQTTDGVREVQLLCRPRTSPASGSREFLTAMLDVTEWKMLERERASAAREQAALAVRLISVQDEERHRLARNLHDDLGQQVTALRLMVEVLAGALRGTESASIIAQVQEQLDMLDRRLHFVATELRPAALDLGVAGAIEQFVRQWSRTVGVPADFRATGMDDTRLSVETETHIYRILQEVLNNVSKHAEAKHLTAVLDRRPDGILLVVEDDGCGFDPAAVRSKEHGLGLVGMRERAQIIGGRLEVESRPGDGTSVFLHVPFTS